MRKPAHSRKVPTVQIKEGVWYRMGDYDRTECCDCGLIHIETFKIEKGAIWFKTLRDDKTTAQRRKELGLKVTRSK